MRAPLHIYQDHSNGTENTNNEFAEFMWMEDIDTFDKQVLQELAEEDEMEKCMEEMLAEEEARETVFFQGQQQQQQQRQPQQGNNMYMGYIPYRLQDMYYQQPAQQPMYQAPLRFNTRIQVSDDILARSKLNPCAKEFVPGRRISFNSSNEETAEVTER